MSAAAPPLLAAGLSLGLLSVAQIDRTPRLIWNASASVPVGLYVVRASHAPSLGELVAVRLPEDLSSWVVEHGYVGADTLLLKHIAAISGMTVCRNNLEITIDGRVVADAASADQQSRPLPRWTGCVKLESGEVFLLIAGVADSLDGRYFGPLSADTIVGHAIPLWTYGGAEDA
ncbi:conjugative transfer signal peptidase TraF [Roseivivax halotolerans]|uniref:Conjugative transfer signal peptidase TraF n=1 Tax=Roseivivax halotolerans TaxID=93684 RepID=A0A1I6AG85_9RHOB|nr:S26 family signal peptidase [Roseivivax halotolerans]SFQ67736.1 conjugative transfer signal peptidase TraF [Roseivivax halotolerans]